MADLGRLWAVEWNGKTKEVHIQYLSETLRGNLIAINENDGPSDYILATVVETPAEAKEAADLLEEKFG